MILPGPRLLLVGAVLIVAGVVVAAILVIGPPAEQRALRMDERRIGDLGRIAQSMDVYWTRTGDLPADLEVLAAAMEGITIPMDPETGGPYVYRRLEDPRYELCADFNRESRETGPVPSDPFWAHGSGRRCFPMEAEDLSSNDR